jgi:heme exporter protein A
VGISTDFETIYDVPTLEVLLDAKNLTAQRGGRVLFSEVSVQLKPGDLRYLRGANGSGKTTLLRTLAGLTEAESGSVACSARLTYWGHSAAVKDELSARENLELLCTRSDVPTAQLDLALARVGLAARTQVLARKLSAGQRRRIGLAWLTLSGERVWLLDEPVAALDSQGVALLADLLNEHAQRGGAALVATHVDVANLAVTDEALTL